MTASLPDPSTEHVPAPHRSWHPSSRAVAAWVSGIVVIALLALAALLPVPFLVISPGPTFNTIGEVDGSPMVLISDTTTYPVTGSLDMTTIREFGAPRSPLTVYQALLAWADPSQAVLPRELLYPDEVSGEEVEQRNATLFSTSQSDAIAAAMGALGQPVIEDVVITSVVSGTPADGRLQAGERIIAVDGAWITTPEQVGEAVRARPIGSTLIFNVEREGSPIDVNVVSAANPDDPELAYVGITVGVNYRAEFPIEFTLTDVGGPSAGLVFSLAIVDKLTPTDLTGGGHVAGTGTINPFGQVGAIGGIRQKLAGARDAGATLFLMPEVHCDEIAGQIPGGLTVVPVATLDDALATLDAWRAGETLRTCPTS